MAQQKRLSKSKYLAGRQCAKRLWLQVHQRELATPPDAALQAIFDMGSEVGRLAWQIYPGGLLVEHGPERHAEAVDHTRGLLAQMQATLIAEGGDPATGAAAPQDPSARAARPALFEAAFEHRGVRVRVDLLELLPDGRVRLCEVKSSTECKPVYLDDLALQCFVLEGSGLEVERCELLHVDRDYLRGEGPVEPDAFFARVDCTAEVRARLAQVEREVERQHELLALAQAPEREVGAHCHSPHGCEFWAHCTAAKPPDWVHHLPRSGRRLEQWRAAGIERIAELPAEAGLDALQERVRRAVCSGEVFVDRGALSAALRALEAPCAFLDFETMNPAIPLHAGTRPYEQIPFQWSLHVLRADGALDHRAFLADPGRDPRRRFAESLIEALAEVCGAVAVYSAYEAQQLRAVARAVPDLAAELAAIRARLVDLLPVVRRCVYHPDFRGSFSIKAVAPALAPHFAYTELPGIRDGSSASAAYGALARGAVTDAAEQQALCRALLAYCAHDTRALVEVRAALHALAAAPAPVPVGSKVL